MGPQKKPQTVCFKRFGAFERIFGVERGACRPAGADARTDGRTDARTHARTDAGSAPDPRPQRTQEKNTPFGAHPLTPIYSLA